MTLGYSSDVATWDITRDGAGNYRPLAINQNGAEAMRITGGNVGVGTTGPDRKLDILDANNPQLRLTQADESKYLDLQVSSTGDLIITSNLGQILKTDSSKYNVLLGQQAGGSEGTYNTVLGYQALYSGTSGSYNVALGTATLYSNTTGDNNTGAGLGVLKYNTSGSNISGFGRFALRQNTSGNYNTAYGANALYYNTTGSYDLALGNSADFGYYPGTLSGTAVGSGGSLSAGTYYYKVSYVLNDSETVLGLPSSGVITLSNDSVNLTAIPKYSGSFSCTARKIYRVKVSDSGDQYTKPYYLLATISDNTTTTYTDTVADTALGALEDGPDYSIMLGSGAKALASNQFVIGSTNGPITQLYIGEGIISATPQDLTINASGGSGTNITGGNIILAGGIGTGTGAGGYLAFKTAVAGVASGTAQGILAEHLRITSSGNVGIGTTTPQSKLQVNGYIQMNTNNGAPAAEDCDADSERGRMILDYTNNLLYICNGATRGWDNISLTD